MYFGSHSQVSAHGWFVPLLWAGEHDGAKLHTAWRGIKQGKKMGREREKRER